MIKGHCVYSRLIGLVACQWEGNISWTFDRVNTLAYDLTTSNVRASLSVS